MCYDSASCTKWIYNKSNNRCTLNKGCLDFEPSSEDVNFNSGFKMAGNPNTCSGLFAYKITKSKELKRRCQHHPNKKTFGCNLGSTAGVSVTD